MGPNTNSRNSLFSPESSTDFRGPRVEEDNQTVSPSGKRSEGKNEKPYIPSPRVDPFFEEYKGLCDNLEAGTPPPTATVHLKE